MSPLLSTFAGAGVRPYGFLSVGSSNFFVGYFTGLTSGIGMDLALDSSGNHYVAGSTAPAGGGTFPFLSAITGSGALSFFKTTTQTIGFGSVAANGSTIALGASQSGVGQFLRVDSAGNITWQRSFTIASATSIGVVTAASGNVYGLVNGSGTSYVVKYNSSGTIQWQKVLRLRSGGANSTATAIGIDSSENIYILGTYSWGKLDSTGAVVWGYSVGSTLYGMRDTANGGSPWYTDPSGNTYVVLTDGASSWTLLKYDTTGTLSWQKIFVGGVVWPKSVTADAAGNVYVGATFNTTTSALYVIKLDSTGAQVWQRKMSVSAGTYRPAGMVATSTGVSITGQLTTNSLPFVMRLPADGSLAGTYTAGTLTFTYATSTDLTVGTGAQTPTSATSSVIAASATDAAGTDSFVGYTPTLNTKVMG